MWIYIATGLVYLGYQVLSGNYKQVLFVRRDVPGVWPMVRHYFFFGPKPADKGSLQPPSEARLHFRDWPRSALGLTGLVIWKPVQFSWLAWPMGGFHLARLWHFLMMWAMLFFVFGHLVMVVLHGWNNFVSMLTGWKKDPEYGSE